MTRHYSRTLVGAALLGVLWLLPLAAAAQVEKAEVRIDGMT